MSTLANSSLEHFFATLFLDYLSHADSIRAGVPSTSALPRKVFDMADEPALPSLVIVAKEDGSKGAQRTVNLSFMHLARIVADDEDAAAVANSATTAEVLATSAQIERRLRTYETADKDGTPLLGFKDWLQTLDDDRLSGWRITKIRHLGAAPLHRKPDKRVIIAACTIDLHIRLVAD